jgi:flavodoxin
VNPIVLYSSKGGNTEKIAKEIANQLNCPCVAVSKKSTAFNVNLEDYDLVFIGTGIYVSKPNSDLLNFLKQTELKGAQKFAIFLTWMGIGKSDENAFDKLKIVLEDKGHTVLDNCFKCYGEGHSLIMRGLARTLPHETVGHPDADDLAAARNWAQEVR